MGTALTSTATTESYKTTAQVRSSTSSGIRLPIFGARLWNEMSGRKLIWTGAALYVVAVALCFTYGRNSEFWRDAGRRMLLVSEDIAQNLLVREELRVLDQKHRDATHQRLVL